MVRGVCFFQCLETESLGNQGKQWPSKPTERKEYPEFRIHQAVNHTGNASYSVPSRLCFQCRKSVMYCHTQIKMYTLLILKDQLIQYYICTSSLSTVRSFPIHLDIKRHTLVCACSTVAQRLPSTCEASGSVPSTTSNRMTVNLLTQRGYSVKITKLQACKTLTN